MFIIHYIKDVSRAASSLRMSSVLSVLLCIIAGFSPVALLGATFTWDGDTDDNFGTNANWAGGTTPPTPNSGSSTDTVLFDVDTASDIVILNQGNNSDQQPVGMLDFGASAGAYTIQDDGTNLFKILGVSAGLTDPGDFYGIRNQSSNLITFDTEIISDAQGGSSLMERLIIHSGTGGLTLNGTVSFESNAKDLVMRGSSDIDMTASLGLDNTTGSTAVFQVEMDPANTVTFDGTMKDMPGVRLISGTLELTLNDGTDIINDPGNNAKDTALEMSGGTLLFTDSGTQVAEFKKTMTLTADSTINLGTGGTVTMSVADASSTAWTGSTTLTIENWKGTPVTGGGDDQIYFGTTSGGLTAQQLSQIQFVNPAGLAPGTYGAIILADGEIVPDGAVAPIPEPRAVAASIGLLMLIGWRERKRLKSWLRIS